jgi:uncharacterized membrane protein HdeD (DUF308 family)
MIEHPVETALGVTLFVAIGLLAGGIVRILLSIIERFDGWGWMLLSGGVSLILGTASGGNGRFRVFGSLDCSLGSRWS